jgi:TonB-linked SusC/RagA family outer membrane protein
VTVRLRPSESALDEVIVVAYGTAKKSSFTGSAAVIDNKKLEKRTVSNITKALDGQVPGVVTTSGGGQPGDGASIRIRGYASINASQSPLYVVDGVPFDGSVNSINPADIESMTVLKDASAGALYGARGANGVIIITTKRGKAGHTDVNVKATYGWSSRAFKRYDMVGQKDFVQLSYEALRNRYVFNNNYTWEAAKQQAIADLGANMGGEIYNPFKNYTWATIIDPGTERVRPDAVSAWNENWMDVISKKNAPRQEYQFSVTGGNDKTQSMLSFGYLKEKGVLVNTGFERFSARGAIDSQAKEWLKAGLNASLSMSKQNYMVYDASSNSNVWYSAQFMAPIYPVYMKDIEGKDVPDAFGNRQLDYGATRPKLTNFNSIGTLYDDKSYFNNDNAGARTYLTLGSDKESYGWLQGLKLTLNLGADYRSQNFMEYYNMFHGNFSNKGGLIEKGNNRIFSYTFNQLLTYKRRFEDHTVDVLAGHESYAYRYNLLYGDKSGLVEGLYELNPATTVDGTGSYRKDYRIESYLARLNYNFREKYYFDASFRTDASSRFHKDNRWGNFWSVGANWRISEEDFIKDNAEWLNNLSLKVSYGIQGNDDILESGSSSSDYYLWQSFYDLTWPNAGLGGAVVTSLENKTVTWEKNANFNTGIESHWLDNRLDFSFEFFNRKTTDLLLSFPMALSTGFLGYNANVGDMVNRGFETSLSGLILTNQDWKWRLTLTASKVNNKVTNLTGDTDEIVDPSSSLRVIKVGKEISTYYLSKSAGVDPATGAQLYWVYDKDDKGNITKEYISSNYQKAANSKYYLGSRIPKLFGSIGTELSYRGIDLSVLTTYSLGGKIYDGLYAGSMNIMYNGDTWHKNQLRRWQKPGDITDVPRVEQNPAFASNDRFLVDASYFAIKNITLGYTLPQSLLQKADIKSLRVFGTLDNFALFSHLHGLDPQYNFTGGSGYSYAPSKTISIGLDIHF